jgi:CRISPR-associated protein Cas1
MNSAIFDAIVSEKRLEDAWKRVKHNKGAAGVDHVSVQQFGAKIGENLAMLRKRLLSGCYRPDRLFQVQMMKHSGGVRKIGVPCMMDRVAQASAALVLNDLLDPLMSDASFAYRRNRSVEHAIGRVMTYRLWGYDWLVDGDIADYFPSIPHRDLGSQLSGLINCAKTLGLIDQWLTSFSKNGVGVAQGSPLSPLLANIYLTPIDNAIHSRRVRLIRYCDDFLLMTKSRGGAEFAKQRIASLLAKRCLKLKAEKTSIKCFADGVEFLGYRFAANGKSVTRATSEASVELKAPAANATKATSR